jgi:hypothetical protein
MIMSFFLNYLLLSFTSMTYMWYISSLDYFVFYLWIVVSSGGTGEHPQPGINGGSGGHSTCTDLDCSVSGGGGGGGTQGNPPRHY